MEAWIEAAVDYIPRWLDYQMRVSEQPGCAVALAHRGKVVLERAFGRAGDGRPLTPRHRFRVASHSKSFTAAGVLKLREAGALGLDDPAGRYVEGLHPAVAEATLAQLLSHSAGLIRDGTDAGQWQDRRPFLDAAALRAALAAPPVLPGSSRFKYSNHGFGLVGLVIEAVTGEPYARWIAREVVAAAGLRETAPDGPPPGRGPVAGGYSAKLPLGRRVVVPGDNPTRALAPATGFVSTAGDLARFFAGLDPARKHSLLSPASRREMIRRLWRDPHAKAEMHYGLGMMRHRVGDWDCAGHGGGFQSCISRSFVLPGRDLAVSVLTNAVDGLANPWADGIVHILRAFAAGGAAGAKTRDWSGRWWSHWRTVDLVPQRGRVLVALPDLANPFLDAMELSVTAPDEAVISRAGGFSSHGESARLVRGRNGRVRDFWLGGTKMVSEARLKSELKRRYEG